jgi:small subunit ribosomal protein S6
MRDYEVIFIANPELDGNAFKDLVERVSNWIKEAGGTVSKVDLWGKRQLAYPIRKKKEGQYVLIESNMAPSFCADLERSLRLTEPVMRFLIVQKN